MAHTLSYIYNMNFSLGQNIDFCLRLVLAFIVGGLVGMERSHRFKEAGIRTHILVCITAALLMLVSKYGFADLAGPAGEALLGTKGADSSRIASQVVSGISFLCAGVIFKVGSNIRGLTYRICKETCRNTCLKVSHLDLCLNGRISLKS